MTKDLGLLKLELLDNWFTTSFMSTILFSPSSRIGLDGTCLLFLSRLILWSLGGVFIVDVILLRVSPFTFKLKFLGKSISRSTISDLCKKNPDFLEWDLAVAIEKTFPLSTVSSRVSFFPKESKESLRFCSLSLIFDWKFSSISNFAYMYLSVFSFSLICFICRWIWELGLIRLLLTDLWRFWGK